MCHNKKLVYTLGLGCPGSAIIEVRNSHLKFIFITIKLYLIIVTSACFFFENEKGHFTKLSQPLPLSVRPSIENNQLDVHG